MDLLKASISQIKESMSKGYIHKVKVKGVESLLSLSDDDQLQVYFLKAWWSHCPIKGHWFRDSGYILLGTNGTHLRKWCEGMNSLSAKCPTGYLRVDFVGGSDGG